jgi:hypothetical protein
MADPTTNNVWKQLHEAQGKYVYFLLAAAGSGIALAVQRTAGEHLRWSMVPLGLAVVCWGYSFFAGCRNRQRVQSHLFNNASILQILSGEDPEVPDNPVVRVEVVGLLKRAMDKDSEAVHKWYIRQFRFLVVGAVLYVVWHVIEMALRA